MSGTLDPILCRILQNVNNYHDINGLTKVSFGMEITGNYSSTLQKRNNGDFSQRVEHNNGGVICFVFLVNLCLNEPSQVKNCVCTSLEYNHSTVLPWDKWDHVDLGSILNSKPPNACMTLVLCPLGNSPGPFPGSSPGDHSSKEKESSLLVDAGWSSRVEDVQTHLPNV